MMLGKRGRPPFRRTTSMTGMTVDVRDMEKAAAPPPPPPGSMIAGEFSGYNNHMLLSPRYLRSDFNLETADFLRRCGLCRRHLAPGHDIYMYRGDTAFCSLECREQQMKQDERKERRATAAPKNGENHHRFELAAAAAETSGNSESVVAT